MNGDNPERRLRAASTSARKKADALHESELAALKSASSADLEALRPKISDAAALDELYAAVEVATKNNEDLAQLKSRLETLGENVVKIAKEVATLM